MPENESTTTKAVQESEAQQVKELLVMRTQVIPAMNLGTETAPDWAVCGRGWKKFSESPNAQTESVHQFAHCPGANDVPLGFLEILHAQHIAGRSACQDRVLVLQGDATRLREPGYTGHSLF